MYTRFKNYFLDDAGSESIEKIMIIGGSIILALIVVTFIGTSIGEQLKLLND